MGAEHERRRGGDRRRPRGYLPKAAPAHPERRRQTPPRLSARRKPQRLNSAKINLAGNSLQRLQASIAEQKNRQQSREVVGLRKQLSHALAALEEARNVRLPRLAPLKPKPRLRGDTIEVYAGDLHGAKQNRAVAAAFLADLLVLRPHRVTLGGDIVDCGGFLAQHHTLGYVAETDYSYEEDTTAGNIFLNGVQENAGGALVEMLEGNHERRVETWCVTQTLRHRRDSEMLRRALAPEFLLHLAERRVPYYRISECYDGLSVPGVIKRGNCFIFHGITTSKHAAAMTLLRTSGNSIFFHTHRAQSDIQRRVGVGIIGAWNPGCLCELQPLWQHGAPTDWTNGYAVRFVSRTGAFLHLNVPIIDGASHLSSAFTQP
jgi:hypothetical protein